MTESNDMKAAIDRLSKFRRSVGHSCEERDLFSVRIGVRVRGWRGRLNRGALTDRDRADISQAIFDADRLAGETP